MPHLHSVGGKVGAHVKRKLARGVFDSLGQREVGQIKRWGGVGHATSAVVSVV
jgi:hypothetical protein